ncbi:MAG: efflux RND transporter periplasmic adaptor subunit [Pirellulales bacterium]
MKKSNLLILLAIAAAVAAWWGISRMSGGLPVEAATARTGEIREFVDEHGKTRLPRTHLITMPFAGRIASIDLEEGAAVSEKQIVARMVPQDLDLSLAAAKAAADRAEAAIVENDDTTVEFTSLLQTKSFVESMQHTVDAAAARKQSGLAKRDFAEKNLARVQRLHEKQVVTDDAMNQAEVRDVESRVDYQQDVLVHAALVAMKAGTDLMPTSVEQYIERKKLKHDVLAKESDQAAVKLREAQRDHDRGTLLSPVNGVVLERHISDEQYLAAGATLLEIGQLDDLEVEVDILSQDVVGISLGAAADVYGPAIGEKPAKARVSRIFPAGFTKVSSLGVEQQRVKVIVRFEEGELDRLRSQRGLGVGYRVNVRVFTAQKAKALLVPRSALFRGAGGAWQVFAVRGGIARLAGVQVGLLNDELAEITKGLAEGETVVLAPETDLADGARVRPLERAAAIVQ